MGYAIQNISALPFGQIIGGPLVACIEAQGMAAKTSVDFIMDVGFTRPTEGIASVGAPDTDIGAVRMVSFRYETVTPGGGTQTVTLDVPLLTIVPIPYIAIEEVNIDFMAKITEAISHDRTSTTEGAMQASTSAKAGWGPFSAGFKGSLSAKHSSTAASSSKYNTELTMNVRVRATQDDMPAGLARVLGILADLVKDQHARIGVSGSSSSSA